MTSFGKYVAQYRRKDTSEQFENKGSDVKEMSGSGISPCLRNSPKDWYRWKHTRRSIFSLGKVNRSLYLDTIWIRMARDNMPGGLIKHIILHSEYNLYKESEA